MYIVVVNTFLYIKSALIELKIANRFRIKITTLSDLLTSSSASLIKVLHTTKVSYS